LLFTCRKPLHFSGKPGKLMELEAIESTVLRHCSLLIRTIIRACPFDVQVRQASPGARPQDAALLVQLRPSKEKARTNKAKGLSPLHSTATREEQHAYLPSQGPFWQGRSFAKKRTEPDWGRHLRMIIYHATAVGVSTIRSAAWLVMKWPLELLPIVSDRRSTADNHSNITMNLFTM
jgi:hypothetical protein